MSIAFHQVTEGEFRRLAETNTMTKILAQESSEISNKFHLIGIDQVNGIGYAVRHGRVAELRVWRLDNLINQARAMGFIKVDVQLT
ncbi:hypothetical protein [Vibrio rarus]|uniref:hypothetical protein n=1 Tax=Vibrio rarus TaxID=413403 RepID=UPI0021C36E70|nr:hypothetical protein [Vibrio rarus]